MRLIKPSTLAEWGKCHGDARPSLFVWRRLIEGHEFRHFTGLRSVFPSADQVTVGSGRTVVVFNIKGNRYRLIAALHYNRALCFALRFMTHAEYSKDVWKDEL